MDSAELLRFTCRVRSCNIFRKQAIMIAAAITTGDGLGGNRPDGVGGRAGTEMNRRTGSDPKARSMVDNANTRVETDVVFTVTAAGEWLRHSRQLAVRRQSISIRFSTAECGKGASGACR